MAENQFRVQDDYGVYQVPDIQEALKFIEVAPCEPAIVVENATGQVVLTFTPKSPGSKYFWTKFKPTGWVEPDHSMTRELHAKLKSEGVVK